MKKKIVLLYNLNRWLEEYEADFDSELTINCLHNSINKNYNWIKIEANRNISKWLDNINELKPDIVFNVTEMFYWASRESFVPSLLEQLEIKYTWPGPLELMNSHNKSLTKLILNNNQNILMPKWYIIKNTEDLNKILLHDLDFPYICKLNSEWSSMWMDEDCIVYNKNNLSIQINKLLSKYNSNILIEKYVDWRDLSITFIEWLWIMEPIEYLYPDSNIYDYKLKTKDNNQVIVKIAENLDENIINNFLKISKDILDILDINWYCRIDFRLDKNNNIYFLELNSQVSFHPDGAFIWWAKTKWYSFDDVVNHIISYSLTNEKRVSNYWVKNIF